MAYIRIESAERVAADVRVIYVAREGEEVDISACINAVNVNLEIGEPITATLRAFVGGTIATAEVQDVVINHLKPRKRRPWHRLRDATRFGDKVRQVEWS